MTRLVKEPLVHFLLLGLGLFVLFRIVSGGGSTEDSRTIDVNRDTLMTFIQFRTRAFDPAMTAERFDAMSPDEQQLLVDDYIREEALYREALALGMDKNDYVIKRRMIQSIEFITSGFATAAVDLSDDELQAWFEQHRDDYYVAPYVTFAHVFFSNEQRPQSDALALATRKLDELNNATVTFGEAPQHGERFPFFVNYVERPPQFLASHFGAPMTEALFSLQPDASVWRGPFESPYGTHLVLLTVRQEGFYPDFDDVKISVRQDAKSSATEALNEEAIQAIVETYTINNTL